MLETISVAIVVGVLGLLLGAFLPGAVVYSILFLRRHGRGMRVYLRLGGRLLLTFFVLSIILGLVFGTSDLLGASGDLESDLGLNSYLVGFGIGLWGSIVAIAVGIRRGRRGRSAAQP